MYQDTNKYSIGLPQGYKSFTIIGHWRIGIVSNKKQSQKDYRYNIDRINKIKGVVEMKKTIREFKLNGGAVIDK